ncbi:MAG: hypothetical protein KDK12_06955 [Rhodobacteraceae bacterium]|nr:hypothetical protein [Paracoccaceae bacterium]
MTLTRLATASALFLALTASLASATSYATAGGGGSAVAGDFNGDGKVDGRDFEVWR